MKTKSFVQYINLLAILLAVLTIAAIKLSAADNQYLINLSSGTAYAATSGCVDPNTFELTELNQLNVGSIDVSDNPILRTFISIVNVLSIGVAIVASITVAIAGMQYMASRGDPNATVAAVNKLTQVGMAIVIFIFGWTLLNWLIPGGVINNSTSTTTTENSPVDPEAIQFCAPPPKSQEPIFANEVSPSLAEIIATDAGDLLADFEQKIIYDNTTSEQARQYAELKNDYKDGIDDNIDWDGNYAGGTVFLKYTARNKPTNEPIKIQLCAWRADEAGKNFAYETCSSQEALTFTEDGTYYVNLGQPYKWWTINQAGFNWDTEPDVMRFMHKFSDNKIVQKTACGAACSAESIVDRNTPWDIEATIIVVPPDSVMQVPDDWECPVNVCGATTAGIN